MDVRERLRRRQRRAGVLGAGGLTALALVTALVVSLTGPTPGVGEIADRPAGEAAPAPDDEVVLDLPDGWQQVRVGDAVLGVPGDREVVHLSADDPAPCTNVDRAPRVYVARDGVAPSPGCDAVGPSHAGVVLVPASQLDLDRWGPRSTAPPSHLETGGGPAAVHHVDDGWGGRLYVLPNVDLVLTFGHLDLEPGLDEAILDTIRHAHG
ncbi:hypothetical protein FTX61_05060 [Nitriliruptoraceae bacterium ZYF776]|nr:hypothetical protein [Profundirhabdus halotolerans]